MKRLIVLLVCLFFLSPQSASAQSNWVIDDFHSDIAVQSNGTVVINETITTDFQTQKHGIYRDIPVVYQDEKSQKTYTKIDVTSVKQDNTAAAYEIFDNDHTIRIRIGNPDKTISGKHVYTVKYIATGVLRSYANYDQLYWNVTGNGWDAAIKKASATVTVPLDKIEKSLCFEGYSGSPNQCSMIAEQSPTMLVVGSGVLSPSEGLTVIANYTKGMVPIVTVDPPKTIWNEIFTLPALLAFPIALASGVGMVLWLWMKKGRDFWFKTRRQLDPNAKEEAKPLGSHEAVVVEFEPPEKLRPAELGVLMDEKADTLDVTATIVDLAHRGFLTITEIEKKWLFGAKDFQLNRTKTTTETLLAYEKLLLDRLFATGNKVTVSSLKTTFYEDLAEVKKKLYEDVMEKKLFVSNPESTRALYFGVAFAVIVGGGILIYAGVQFIVGPFVTFGAGIILSGIIFLFVANNMPRRSAYGRELYQRVKGYQLFISSAEQYRQQFFEKKNMFNEVLPYAIVFGLTGKFAVALKEMGVQPKNPTWYSGTHVFTPSVFASDVNSFSKSFSSAIASTPSSSSSGGSSGGGFGGGGGGSW